MSEHTAGAWRYLVPLAATAAALMALPVTSYATTSVSQTFKVPSDGTFTVVGHGFGHGHGMSQYGANGAAKQGLTAKQILAFYYPGTTLTTATGSIKVLISADTTDDVQVVATSGQSVYDYGAKQSYALPTNLDATRWRLTVSGSASVVEYYVDQVWHRWKPGGQATLDGDGGFRSDSGKNSLILPGGTQRAYRGSLIAASPSSGSTARNTVNSVSLDDYVKGVVASEMPASWDASAVKAQAIAARTYGAWQRATPRASYYDICDSTACQVYGGVAREVSSASQLVDDSAGQVLSYQGKPAFTQFSSSSGGWTSAGSQPYLKHQADPYDDYSGNPVHSWSKSVSETTIEKAYTSIGDLKSIKVTKREGNGQWHGRVQSLTLVGSKGSKTITGDALRSTLGLRSSWFWFKS